MNLIKVDIDAASNTISVWNNGKGIPIEVHKEHNCFVPEMIFGKFLALLNFIFVAYTDFFVNKVNF